MKAIIPPLGASASSYDTKGATTMSEWTRDALEWALLAAFESEEGER